MLSEKNRPGDEAKFFESEGIIFVFEVYTCILSTLDQHRSVINGLNTKLEKTEEANERENNHCSLCT